MSQCQDRVDARSAWRTVGRWNGATSEAQFVLSKASGASANRACGSSGGGSPSCGGRGDGSFDDRPQRGNRTDGEFLLDPRKDV
jgi:hypothetical protein